jgi:hypothetical protein
MAANRENPVTQWVNDLKAGDRDEAAHRLWQRDFERLARLAQARLHADARGPADGEDVARMEGHSGAGIAAKLDCSLRSVERELELIRRTWGPEAGG